MRRLTLLFLPLALVLAVASLPTLCSAQEERVTYDFGPSVFGPNGPLVQGSITNNLYGTAGNDGSSNGEVYQLADGTLNVILNPANGSSLDGPVGAMVTDTNENLYGVSNGTIAFCTNCPGEVWKLTSTPPAYTSFTLTTLHTFNSSTEGAFPRAGLSLGSDGNLYGATWQGASANCGAAFKITKSGTFSVLHVFNGSHDGCNPNAPPILITLNGDPTVIGTTLNGGANNLGTIWAKDLVTGAFKLLRVLAGGASDGANPYSGLIPVVNSTYPNEYAVQTSAGGSASCGTFFLINVSTKTVDDFYSFPGGASNGCAPHGELAVDNGGNFFGTTSKGGLGSGNGYGTVTEFELSPPCFPGPCFPTYTEKVAYFFQGYSASDGAVPNAGVIIDQPIGSGATLYGATSQGGNDQFQGGNVCTNLSCGTIFSLSALGD